MLYELEVNKFEFNYQLDEDGRITLLFFAHPESLILLKQYLEVLLIDCTYKTNHFCMPLRLHFGLPSTWPPILNWKCKRPTKKTCTKNKTR